MIQSRNDYLYYLECDKLALKYDNQARPNVIGDLIWKYERLLRKTEYMMNCQKGNRLTRLFTKYQFRALGLKLGFSIPVNTCGPGLSLAHYGTVIINTKAKIGSNCRIQTGVTIGTTNGSNDAPILGDNIFLGDGCKIIGSIKIADGVQIGANAVVVKDICEPHTSWGGVPAKCINQHGATLNVIPATARVDKTRFYK